MPLKHTPPKTVEDWTGSRLAFQLVASHRVLPLLTVRQLDLVVDAFSLVSSRRMCHSVCNLCDTLWSLPRWIRARFSTESPCGPFFFPLGSQKMVEMIFTACAQLDPICHCRLLQDTVCVRTFSFFEILKVYINKRVLLYLSVMFDGRAGGVHSLDLSSHSVNLCVSPGLRFFITVGRICWLVCFL